ncbi:hypothetical protein Xszus_00629 [Xenorhabdus szentirmaii]|nr:hypothetical protein Xszus_00629 [Xenorhabdus szentirmaii]
MNQQTQKITHRSELSYVNYSFDIVIVKRTPLDEKSTQSLIIHDLV